LDADGEEAGDCAAQETMRSESSSGSRAIAIRPLPPPELVLLLVAGRLPLVFSVDRRRSFRSSLLLRCCPALCAVFPDLSSVECSERAPVTMRRYI
jgi:hypothetical protein